MSGNFDFERTDKEMAERYAALAYSEMDEAQRAEFDKGEAAYAGLFVPTPEEVLLHGEAKTGKTALAGTPAELEVAALIADPDHVETCILDEDGRCDVAYHSHHYYLSRAEERRAKAARMQAGRDKIIALDKAKKHETYKANVLRNAKYSWKAAQDRADQLERIYADLLKQGRIGR